MAHSKEKFKENGSDDLIDNDKEVCLDTKLW